MKTEFTVLIADDHTLFREGLLRIMQIFPQYRVVATASNGLEAELMIRKLRPDIAILDISMPHASGIEVVKNLQSDGLNTLPVILTMSIEEQHFEEALANGVKGYLLKDSTIDEIEECLQTILSGKYFVSAKLSNFLVAKLNLVDPNNRVTQIINSLTNAELKVMRLLAQKKTSTQISSELFISYRTVQKHRQNISAKLGLQGYNQLLLFASEYKKYFQ